MRLAGLQLAADLHEEDRVMLAHDGVFALLGGLVGVAVLQLLRGDEIHVALELRVQAREGDAQRVVRLADRADDVAHGALEIVHGAVFTGDDLFPVPLVDVDGVEVVDLLVAADGIHVGEKSLAGVELIALERQALPLRQRMDDLRVYTDIRNVEAHRTLVPIQIIIQAGILLHKKGRGHSAQIQRIAQIGLKVTFDKFDGALHFIRGQRRAISLRDHELAHKNGLLSEKYAKIIV